MTGYQRNQHIADIGDRANTADLEVYVTRWPDLPGGRPNKVMWLTPTGHYNYLSPQRARQFAQALILAAIEAETS